jgi:hypothetical protein
MLQKVKTMFALEPSTANTSTANTEREMAKDQTLPNTKTKAKNQSTTQKTADLKINLLTASNELRNQINSWAQGGNITSSAGIKLSSNRKKEDVEKFINGHSINTGRGIKKQFSSFCSAEITFFSLKTRVDDGMGNSFSLICFCEAGSPSATNPAVGKSTASATQSDTKRRLPFNIIRIEEI